MDLTEGREQVDVGTLGVNSRDVGGCMHMKKNVFLFGVLQKVLGVTNEERVDPGLSSVECMISN